MPGVSTEAESTGFSGIFASFKSAKEILIPPTLISRGGGEEHSFSLQETGSPSSVANRREMYRSGLPLSTQA